MAFDFKNFPELTNRQMEIYYFESPHKQITEDFTATVTKVIDGDTIRVKWKERDFDFKVRFLGTASAEIGERGGEIAQKTLERKIKGKVIDIQIDKKNRVGKWGRLLGRIFLMGEDINQYMIDTGLAVDFDRRKETKLPDISKILEDAVSEFQ